MTEKLLDIRQINLQDFVTRETLGPGTARYGQSQGSPLSPVLFNVYTYDIGKTLGKVTHMLHYADDINKTIEECILQIEFLLVSVTVWLRKHNFELSTNKCSILKKKY